MIAVSVCLAALLPFCLLLLGLLWFADDLDGAKLHVECPCGRRDIHCVANNSAELDRIRDLLAANCPWCTPVPLPASIKPKGVDVHA